MRVNRIVLRHGPRFLVLSSDPDDREVKWFIKEGVETIHEDTTSFYYLSRRIGETALHLLGILTVADEDPLVSMGEHFGELSSILRLLIDEE